MTNETKHTPWFVVDTPMESSILDSRGYIVCASSEECPVSPSLPEMQYIVKCVNMHDELVGALLWYAEQGEGCRKITGIGNIARNKLDNDGGKLARETLKKAGAL